jgi:hypothetical protein
MVRSAHVARVSNHEMAWLLSLWPSFETCAFSALLRMKGSGACQLTVTAGTAIGVAAICGAPNFSAA